MYIHWGLFSYIHWLTNLNTGCLTAQNVSHSEYHFSNMRSYDGGICHQLHEPELGLLPASRESTPQRNWHLYLFVFVHRPLAPRPFSAPHVSNGYGELAGAEALDLACSSARSKLLDAISTLPPPVFGMWTNLKHFLLDLGRPPASSTPASSCLKRDWPNTSEPGLPRAAAALRSNLCAEAKKSGTYFLALGTAASASSASVTAAPQE